MLQPALASSSYSNTYTFFAFEKVRDWEISHVSLDSERSSSLSFSQVSLERKKSPSLSFSQVSLERERSPSLSSSQVSLERERSPSLSFSQVVNHGPFLPREREREREVFRWRALKNERQRSVKLPPPRSLPRYDPHRWCNKGRGCNWST